MPDTTEQGDKGGAQSKQSNHSRSNSRQDGNREFFKAELKRLQDSLQREASKIQKPPRHQFTPYCFTTLESYYQTGVASQVIKNDPVEPKGYSNRNTAIGLCDPWVDHNMDKDFKRNESSTPQPQQKPGTKKEDSKKRGGKKVKEGSTRLPKFPAVTVTKNGELHNKILNYGDVPTLRKELREKYSMNAQQKINEEYTRTKQDFYRMDLDKVDEYHPINRGHMKDAYFAYLQNNPGSSKAVKECVTEVMPANENEARSRPTSSHSQRSRPSSSRSRQSIH